MDVAVGRKNLEIFDHTKMMRPGQMCFYRNGKIGSFVLEELSKNRRFLSQETPTCNSDDSQIDSSYFEDGNIAPKAAKRPTIEVSVRDFLASLSRII